MKLNHSGLDLDKLYLSITQKLGKNKFNWINILGKVLGEFKILISIKIEQNILKEISVLVNFKKYLFKSTLDIVHFCDN